MLHFFTAVSRHEVTPLRSWSQACHKRGQTWLAQEMVEFFPGCSLQSFGAKSSSLSCTDAAVIYATIINAILSPNVTDGLHE